jgi:hypothetical protein
VKQSSGRALTELNPKIAVDKVRSVAYGLAAKTQQEGRRGSIRYRLQPGPK